MFVGVSGAHFIRSAQVRTEMIGMRSEWSMQRARRFRVCAVLAMHVTNSGILKDSSSLHRQVKLDIHTLESLFGECFIAVTNKRIEIVA